MRFYTHYNKLKDSKQVILTPVLFAHNSFCAIFNI